MADTALALKQIYDSSSQLSGWALAILGGTVAAIASTSYRRPEALMFRLPYLLFLPGWAAIAKSLYLGNILSGKYIATLLVKADVATIISSQINDAYASQRYYLFLSIAFFGLWLVLSLTIWIFVSALQKEEKK